MHLKVFNGLGLCWNEFHMVQGYEPSVSQKNGVIKFWVEFIFQEGKLSA